MASTKSEQEGQDPPTPEVSILEACSVRNQKQGVREMAKSAKCLLCKHEDRSPEHPNPCEGWGEAAHTYNVSAGRTKTGGSLEFTGKLV